MIFGQELPSPFCYYTPILSSLCSSALPILLLSILHIQSLFDLDSKVCCPEQTLSDVVTSIHSSVHVTNIY